MSNCLPKGQLTLYSIDTSTNEKEQFLLLPQCFLLNQIFVATLVHISVIISLFAAELEEPKIGKCVKG